MPSYKNAYEASKDERKQVVGDRQVLMCRETEAWLVDQCRNTLEKERAWKFDYRSPEAFQKSCDPYRKKWTQTLGEFAFKANYDVQYESFFEVDHSIARWVYKSGNYLRFFQSSLCQNGGFKSVAFKLS